MICLLSSNKDLHWHASILVLAFVVPPTVILIGLMRGVYRSNASSTDKDEIGIPAVDLTKDLFKEFTKKLGESAAKTSP